MFYSKLLCAGKEFYDQHDSVRDIIALEIYEEVIRSISIFAVLARFNSKFIAFMPVGKPMQHVRQLKITTSGQISFGNCSILKSYQSFLTQLRRQYN